MHDEFSKRQQDPDFEQIMQRVRAVVSNDPGLRQKVDSDERAFCSMYDRLANSTRKSRLEMYEVARCAPIIPPKTQEEEAAAARASRLKAVAAAGGSVNDVAYFLTQEEKTDG